MVHNKGIAKLCFFVALLSFWSCNRKLEPVEPETSKMLSIQSFFPQDSSKFRLYEVAETTYTLRGSEDPIQVVKSYYSKELQAGYDKDLLGRTVQKLEVWRTDSTKQLQDLKWYWLWHHYQDNNIAERIEGNTRYVVLNTPLQPQNRWNGNRFNNKGQEMYQILSIDTIWTINGTKYDNCIYIQQNKIDNSQLQETNVYEVYAPKIGKIARYERRLIFDIITVDSITSYRRMSTDSRIYEEKIINHNF